MSKFVAFLVSAIIVAASGAASARAAAPLIGVTYTHTAVAADCNLDNPRSAIVLTYDETGVRRRVRGQLAAMRAAGLQTIRILLWNMTSRGTHVWGVIPSVNGRLSEPYRTNLVRFTRDIRDAGFDRFTVHFSPQWTNNPLGEYGPSGLIRDVWDPSKFEENWGFIREARTLIKRHGPAATTLWRRAEGHSRDRTPGPPMGELAPVPVSPPWFSKAVV